MIGKLITMKAVSARTGLPSYTVDRLADIGRFPPPVMISEKGPRWWDNEIEDWLDSLQRRVPRPRFMKLD